jgi:16S rRNA (cytidine1402-2'-O)-methyltransferase
MSGTLFVVGTPIGNLEDLTFRALRTLKEVDLIAAEDTRRTSKLLAHFDIRKSLLSVHEHNEHREIPRILERIGQGESVALVTDAGTPGIADPGAHLVRAAYRAGVRVVPIPGPSAVATALSVSGYSASEFVFMGFPPRSGREREQWFHRLTNDPRVLVFFEAPHRIDRTLTDLQTLKVIRPIIVCREITKMHEQLVFLSNESPAWRPLSKGEFTIVLGPGDASDAETAEQIDVVDIFGRLMEQAGLSEATAVHILDKAFNVGPSTVRKALKRHRISVKQQNRDSA